MLLLLAFLTASTNAKKDEPCFMRNAYDEHNIQGFQFENGCCPYDQVMLEKWSTSPNSIEWLPDYEIVKGCCPCGMTAHRYGTECERNFNSEFQCEPPPPMDTIYSCRILAYVPEWNDDTSWSEEWTYGTMVNSRICCTIGNEIWGNDKDPLTRGRVVGCLDNEQTRIKMIRYESGESRHDYAASMLAAATAVPVSNTPVFVSGFAVLGLAAVLYGAFRHYCMKTN